MISIEEFVKIWNDAHSIKEVEKKTKMKQSAIYARVKRYRDRGYELKRYRLPVMKQPNVEGS